MLPSFDPQPAATQTSKPFNFSFASATSAASQSPAQPATPQFSFLKPVAPVSISTEPASKSGSTDQIESQKPEKRPSIGGLKFPSVQFQPTEPASTTPAASPIQPQPAQKNTVFSAPEQQLQLHHQTQSPSIAELPRSEPEEAQPPERDEEKLLGQLCRIGLVQKDGVLDMFVSYKVSSLVKEVFKAFQDQLFVKQTSKHNAHFYTQC